MERRTIIPLVAAATAALIALLVVPSNPPPRLHYLRPSFVVPGGGYCNECGKKATRATQLLSSGDQVNVKSIGFYCDNHEPRGTNKDRLGAAIFAALMVGGIAKAGMRQ